MVITARQIIERMREKLDSEEIGVGRIDKITAGNMDMEVKGVASVMMVTLDVAKRAIDKGLNMIITHESTFFSHQDSVGPFQNDDVYKYKRDFFEKNNMVVLHVHDALHKGMPDRIQQTLMKVMGWENNINLDAGRNFFELPPISLVDLAQKMAEKFDTRTIRVEGDPEMIINNVMTSLGNAGADRCVPALGRDDVDAFIFGETDEWESAGYVLDAIKAGRKKALIYIGHMQSEQPGMKILAEQMKEYVTEVPVEFINLPEMFWRTDNPVWEFKQLT